MVVISVSLEEFQKKRRGCSRQDTQDTSVQYILITTRRTLNAPGSRPSVICKHPCPQVQVLSSGVSHVSSMVVLSRAFLHEHFLFFTYLSYHTTRTLSTSRITQDHSVNKFRHQESLWREDLQSGGNPAHNNSHRL